MSYLIIRGASSTDDLGYYGEMVASRYATADTVILVDKENNPHFSKGANHPLTKMEFLDLEDDLNEFSLLLLKIKDAYEFAHNSGNKPSLAHSFIGNWLFYYPNGDKFNYQLMIRQNFDRLRESADEFIEKDFGMSSTPILNSDGSKKRSNEKTERIPS